MDNLNQQNNDVPNPSDIEMSQNADKQELENLKKKYTGSVGQNPNKLPEHQQWIIHNEVNEADQLKLLRSWDNARKTGDDSKFTEHYNALQKDKLLEFGGLAGEAALNASTIIGVGGLIKGAGALGKGAYTGLRGLFKSGAEKSIAKSTANGVEGVFKPQADNWAQLTTKTQSPFKSSTAESLAKTETAVEKKPSGLFGSLFKKTTAEEKAVVKGAENVATKKPGFFGKLGNAVGNTFGAVGNIATGLGSGIASMFGAGQGSQAGGSQGNLEHVSGEIIPVEPDFTSEIASHVSGGDMGETGESHFGSSDIAGKSISEILTKLYNITTQNRDILQEISKHTKESSELLAKSDEEKDISGVNALARAGHLHSASPVYGGSGHETHEEENKQGFLERLFSKDEDGTKKKNAILGKLSSLSKKGGAVLGKGAAILGAGAVASKLQGDSGLPTDQLDELIGIKPVEPRMPKTGGPGGKFSPEVEEAIQKAADETGMDVGYLRTMAKIESGGDPNASNKSGAKGLYQFIPGTAKQYGLSGKEFDAKESALAAAKLSKDNAAELQKHGIEATPEMLYLAHQQGVGGAVKLINAAKEGKSWDQLDSKLKRNMAANAGGGKSAKEFVDMWSERYKSKSGGPIETIPKLPQPAGIKRGRNIVDPDTGEIKNIVDGQTQTATKITPTEESASKLKVAADYVFGTQQTFSPTREQLNEFGVDIDAGSYNAKNINVLETPVELQSENTQEPNQVSPVSQVTDENGIPIIPQSEINKPVEIGTLESTGDHIRLSPSESQPQIESIEQQVQNAIPFNRIGDTEFLSPEQSMQNIEKDLGAKVSTIQEQPLSLEEAQSKIPEQGPNEIENLSKNVSNLAKIAAIPGSQPPSASPTPPIGGGGKKGKMLNVRNDDPVFLQMLYGNVRVV